MLLHGVLRLSKFHHVKPNFYFDGLPWRTCSCCMYVCDITVVNLNGKMLMKWLSQQLEIIFVFIASYSETAEAENTASIVRALVCVWKTKQCVCTIHHSFIAEIMASYEWCQILPQICIINIAFHLSIANHAYCFVLVNSISAMISTVAQW